ncbi:MAG: TonB-dependent receptor [Pseudomonadota bacterium]
MNAFHFVKLCSRGFVVAALVSLFSLGQVAQAQETVAAVRGTVTDDSGAALPGVTVTVVNEDNGLTRSVVTNASGIYSVRNLPLSGSYSISAGGGSVASERIEDISLVLGQTTTFDFDLAAGGGIEEVTVVGSATAAGQSLATGPSAVFSLETLESAPAINRNITDFLRLDPRIAVDESRGDINPIQCAGKNPRFNSFTLDGVKINDLFGLNSNGYPTERIPFSIDAIQEVSVELAPFDVEYGSFTACNINSVTKSGGNEFHGTFFYDYTSDSLRGDSLEGDNVLLGDYDETRYGLTVSGPIIEDKLFFTFSASKDEGSNLYDRGPLGSGAINEVEVTQAELDEIVDIARNIYQYDPGPIPSSLDNDDEKLLVKLDWNISDSQRASFTYLYNDGFNTVESDGDNDEFEFQNHLYERGTELDVFSAKLFSDWSDKFSTEISFGYIDVDNRQETVGGLDFGEIRVELADVDVYLGGDDSRQANDLDYDSTSLTLKGNYLFDNGHELSFGYQRESIDIFNLFVQHVETEIRFDGIDDFRNGFADAIYYNNAPTNNAADAAAEWGYDVNTAFIQDSFDVNDRLSIVAGLRYDWYTTSDAPLENPQFVEDYGFSNSTNLDGEGLLQPRVAFTFDYNDSTTFTGGVGLFSGGDPNVWLSNTFSANNVLQFGQRGRSFGYTDGTRSLFDSDVVYAALEPGVPNGPGYGVPSELFDAVAGGVGDNFELNYLDPNFEIPSEWKIALGVTHITENEYVLQADLLLTEGNDNAIVLRGDLEQTGTTAEGYPEYDSVREPSFVLTNSNVGNESFTASVSVSKEYENGVSFTLGYAYNDAEDVSPMTSSVAFSNYINRAFFDPQEQVLSTSNYSVAHRITGQLKYEKAFFGDNMTTVTLAGFYQSGDRYSRAFNGTINPYGFTPFLDFEDNVLEPGARRNAFEGPSWLKVDLKIEQEFPGFSPDHKGSVFLVIDNFTNFINDDWGILDGVVFPNNVDIDDTTPFSRDGEASLYEIRFGVSYDF